MRLEYDELSNSDGRHSIRLLELLPGTELEPICGQLFHAKFDEAPSYEALSYCWGNTSSLISISLNGNEFSVTPSLFAALKRLRRLSGSRILWIDAVCIDQGNLDEKNEQVSVMRFIYRKAERTNIWLGQLPENCDEGLTLLSQLFQLAKTREPFKRGRLVDEYCTTDLPLPANYQWKALGSILSSFWFSRKWIIQEVATSKSLNVIVGHEEIDLEHIGDAANFALLSGLDDLVDIDFGPSSLLWNFRSFYRKGIRFPLLRLFNSFQSYQTTDPGDHLYALVGLALREDDPNVLQFDYRMSFVEISTLMVRMIMTDTKQLDCFKGVDREILEGSRTRGLPSWVTDWSNCDLISAISFTGIGEIQMFSASRDTKHISQFPELPGHVTVRGMQVDDIVHLGRGFRKTRNPLFNFLRWKAFAQRHLRSPNSTKRYFYKAFCLTLLGGNGIHTPKATRKDVRLVKEFLEYLKQWKSADNFGKSRDNYERPDDEHIGITMMQLRKSCKDRQLAITAKGRIGLVPRGARVGDGIVLMMGADLPYAVRTNGQQAWNLVGHCYIHGIMEGTAFDLKKCENILLA